MSLNQNSVTFNQIAPVGKKGVLGGGENLDIFAGVWYHQKMTVDKREKKSILQQKDPVNEGIDILHHGY